MKEIAALFSVLAAALACAGTDVGNGIVELDVALYNDQVDPAVASANGVVDIDSAWISVTVFRLLSGDGCDEELEIQVPPGVAIDMLAPGAISELMDVEIPLREYCQFRMKLDGFSSTPPSDAPAELQSSSIAFAGTRADGTEFVLYTEQDEEYIFDARGGVFSVSDATNALIVAFDGSRLFAGVDLDDATVGTDGVVRVSEDDNESLLEEFESNFADAAELYDDDDGDGEIDEDERDDDDDILGD